MKKLFLLLTITVKASIASESPESDIYLPVPRTTPCLSAQITPLSKFERSYLRISPFPQIEEPASMIPLWSPLPLFTPKSEFTSNEFFSRTNISRSEKLLKEKRKLRKKAKKAQRNKFK